MLITIKDPDLMQSLLAKQALKPELIHDTSGQRLDFKNRPVFEPCVVLASDLNRGTQLYLQACSLFGELQSCHRLLREALNSEDLSGDFQKVLIQIADRIKLIAAHQFDLAYAYLSWHSIEDYPYMHHLIVALTLARVAEQSKEFSDSEINSCMGAALSMNISMLSLQSDLRNQTKPLTKEQRDVIRRHPEQGVSQLRLLGVTDEKWLEVVANHHETPTGQGYPNQVKLQDQATLLLNVCDSFNARIAQRDYRNNYTAEEAIRELFAKADPRMCELISVLLEELGIYPAGSLLQLQDGQIGCSLVRGQSSTCPLVLVFGGADHRSGETALVDSSKREFAVKKSLTRRELAKLPNLLDLIAQIA